MSACFVLVHPVYVCECVCVCQYLSKIPCVPGLVGVMHPDLNLYSSVSSPSKEGVQLQ